jgi:uridine kinase
MLVVGVAGGTGSGKTTIAQKLGESLPEGQCTVIEHDSYYRDRSHLSSEQRALINYDHPEALESDLLATHLAELRAGRSVELPIYDFVTHTRKSETRKVSPTRVVIVEGILTFVDESVREQLDIKIFVDTDADIRLLRRIRRDLERRGRQFAAIRDQYYKHVRPMHLQFVEPSKQHADIIVPEGGSNKVALDVLVARLIHA